MPFHSHSRIWIANFLSYHAHRKVSKPQMIHLKRRRKHSSNIWRIRSGEIHLQSSSNTTMGSEEICVWWNLNVILNIRYYLFTVDWKRWRGIAVRLPRQLFGWRYECRKFQYIEKGTISPNRSSPRVPGNWNIIHGVICIAPKYEPNIHKFQNCS